MGIQGPSEFSPTLGAVDKAMFVLTTVITHGAPLRLCDLIRLTGVPKATVHRLVSILRRHRMLDLQDGRYVLGERLTTDFGADDGDYRRMLQRESTPYLVELHRSTGLSASVGVLSGDEVVFLDRVFDHQAVRTRSFYSDRAPAHVTAIGEVLRAGSSPVATAGNQRKLHPCVTRTNHRPPQGVTCIAALVDPGFGGRAPTGLVLSGRTTEAKVPRIATMLRSAAYRLSRSILRVTDSMPA